MQTATSTALQQDSMVTSTNEKVKAEEPLYFNSAECLVSEFTLVIDLHSFCD